MKLRPELRNCIYEAVVTSERIGIKKRPFMEFATSQRFKSQPFTSSSRILLANKEVSCEYDAVLKRLVLDPKAMGVVIEEDWVDMGSIGLLKLLIQLSSPKNRYSIMSKLKLRVVLTGSHVITGNLYYRKTYLQSWSDFCSMYGITAEYEVLGDESTIAAMWEVLNKSRKVYESQGNQIGKEHAKILRAFEDANRQETSGRNSEPSQA